MLAAIAMAAAMSRLPPPIRGDFDHDGRQDVAQVVRGSHGGYRLVAHRGAAGHPDVVVTALRRDELHDFFLTIEKPGRLETWCGKGGDDGGDPNAPCRRFVTLRGDTLAFGMRESTESVAIWTGGRFEVVLISD